MPRLAPAQSLEIDKQHDSQSHDRKDQKEDRQRHRAARLGVRHGFYFVAQHLSVAIIPLAGTHCSIVASMVNMFWGSPSVLCRRATFFLCRRFALHRAFGRG